MNLEEEPDDDPRISWLRRAIWLLVLVGLGACLSEGANAPADPHVEQGEASAGGRTPIEGVGEVAFRVQPAAEGIPSTTEFCALVAETDEQRAQGLMHQDSMRGYDAMLFTFGDSDTTIGFHMRDTPLPLTVAWFDAAGHWVGAADMAPCTGDDCPTYSPPAPYRFALEVAQPDRERIGLGPDVRIDLGGTCTR